MSSDDRILSDQEVILDVMSRNFFNLEMPVTDFNLFLHCDVNEIFANLQLNIPRTDGAATGDPPVGDTPNGDQTQPRTGVFTPEDWRTAYQTHIQGNQAYRSASYSTDKTSPNILCNLVREILSVLFLGNKSDQDVSNLQTGVYGTSRLRFKTEHLYPWLNASDDTKDSGKWGVECFQSVHFESIHRALVAKNKYTAILAADNVTRTHGVINLSAGDSIGVRVTLKENDSNLLHVNFYLQQVAGYESVAPLLVPTFTGSDAITYSGASYSVSASSEESTAYRACDDSAQGWTSASGMFDAFTGEHKTTGDNTKIKHGREGEFVRVAVNELRALTEVKWDFGPVASAPGTPKDFRIMISFDGADYVVLHDVTNYTSSGPQTLNLTGKEYFAMEVVLHITKIHKNDVLTACTVVEFMGSSIAAFVQPILTQAIQNVDGVTYSVLGTSGINGYHAFDGELDTSWDTATDRYDGTTGAAVSGVSASFSLIDGEQLDIETSTPQIFSSVSLNPGNEPANAPRRFLVWAMDSQFQWTVVYDGNTVDHAFEPDTPQVFTFQSSVITTRMKFHILAIQPNLGANSYARLTELTYA